MGSFRLAARRGYLHPQCYFAESHPETVGKSLCHSCRSELTRQGISLPYDRYSYGLRLPGIPLSVSLLLRPPFTGSSVRSFGLRLTSPLSLPAPGRHRTLYVVFRLSRVLCF